MGVEAGGVERGDPPSLPEVLKPDVLSALFTELNLV